MESIIDDRVQVGGPVDAAQIAAVVEGVTTDGIDVISKGYGCQIGTTGEALGGDRSQAGAYIYGGKVGAALKTTLTNACDGIGELNGR